MNGELAYRIRARVVDKLALFWSAQLRNKLSNNTFASYIGRSGDERYGTFSSRTAWRIIRLKEERRDSAILISRKFAFNVEAHITMSLVAVAADQSREPIPKLT